MALTASMYARLVAAFTDVLDQQTVSGPLNLSDTIAFTDGTGANKVQQMFADDRTLAAAATEDLDMAGSLKNAFGLTITFTKIKVLFVSALAANTNNVVVGGAAANQLLNWVGDASDKLVVRPGGFFFLVAPDATGYAVTAGTGDLLKIGNSAAGTAVTYTIVIAGEGSAA